MTFNNILLCSALTDGCTPPIRVHKLENDALRYNGRQVSLSAGLFWLHFDGMFNNWAIHSGPESPAPGPCPAADRR